MIIQISYRIPYGQKDMLKEYITALLKVVEDIEDVAKRLEMYGYKVNIILGNENLFNKFNNRYYYNIIKTKDLEINLKNIISDNATIENIKSRFNNGLRLWNTRDIGNFKYDNIEKIELEV